MKTRPKVTKKLIMQATGENQGLVSSVYHGLYEMPALKEFYPHLDLPELLSFTASSWKARHENPAAFLEYSSELFPKERAYDLFSSVFSGGMSWLNKHHNVSEELEGKWIANMPFNKRNFRDRIERVDESSVRDLIESLNKPVNEYVFEIQYPAAKARRQGNNHGLIIMDFQNVYPKSEKIVPAFAAEVARQINRFSGDYELLD